MRQNPSLAIIFPALCGNNFSFFTRNTKFTIKAFFFIIGFFLDKQAFVMLGGPSGDISLSLTVCDV